MSRLKWSIHAWANMRDIGAYIARDDPAAARRHVERLRLRARQAAEHPRSGRVVPEVNRDAVRELIEGNYRIVYKIGDRSVEILAVSEGHRLLRAPGLDDEG